MTNKKFSNVFVIDDSPVNVKLLNSILSKAGYQVRGFQRGGLAIDEARKEPPDAFLLDIHMPEMNGYEVCEQLKKDSDLKTIPVIFISALNDTFDKVKAFECGGVDYVTKPFQVAEVLARLDIHLKLRRYQQELMEKNQALEEALIKLEHMATHDSLTGLPTRLLAMDHFKKALAMAQRSQNQAAILFLDLDGFKDVNDTIGHEAGDELLIQVGQRLLATVRKIDTVARFGGDEFLIILYNCESSQMVAQVAQRIIESIARPFHLSSGEATIGVSIGAALSPEHGENAEELIRKADSSMYSIKRSGKNSYAISL